jgi:hypothetical protein
MMLGALHDFPYIEKLRFLYTLWHSRARKDALCAADDRRQERKTR